MDRQIVYAGAIPQDSDILNSNKNAMVAIAALAKAIFGLGATDPQYNAQMWFDGLECVPGAGLSVTVNPGQIFQLSQTDSTQYGSLPIDNTVILKQGFLKTATNFNCPAPTVSGQYISYLIEFRFREVDDTGEILEYYNSADPSTPLNGPGGNNAYQNTMRRCVVDVQIKASAAAILASLVDPVADAGWTGMYYVHVAYGQSTIAPTDIHVQYPLLNVAWGLISKIASMNGKYSGSGIDAYSLQGQTLAQVIASAKYKWQGCCMGTVDTIAATSLLTSLHWGQPINGASAVLDTFGSILQAGQDVRLIVPGGADSRRVKVKMSLLVPSITSRLRVYLRYFKSGTSDLVNGYTLSWMKDVAGSVEGATFYIESPVMDVAPGDFFETFYILPDGSLTGSGAISNGSFFEMEVLS